MKRLLTMGSILILTAMLIGCKPYHEKKLPSPSAYQAHFIDMDTNSDQRVDWPEFRQHFPNASPHVFEALDLDKDSSVDHDEWHDFKKAHGHKK